MTDRLSSSVRDVLRQELAGTLRGHEPPLEVAGSRLDLTIAPDSGAELATTLAVLTRESVPVLVRGGGNRLALGNPCRGAQVLLCCRGLVGVDELDAADGVMHAAAGTPLGELSRQARHAGWELPLDPPGENATLGGALATAIGGPRRLGFGPTRDCVLGLEVVLASGERTRCGGRVVKNVTGYDLAKLYVGSLGTLGVIEAAWLRLHPAPRLRLVRVAQFDAAERAFTLALEAARRPSASAVAVVSAGLAERAPELRELHCRPGSWMLVCEFAGDAAVCGADRDWLARAGGAQEAREESVTALRELQTDAAPGGLRARLHALPSSLEAIARHLRAAGAELLVYPIPGVVYASFAPREPAGRDHRAAWFDAALAALEEAKRFAAAEFVLEELPDSRRAECDVFGAAGGSLGLMRALKRRFDPQGLLNPGRFVGGV